MADDDSILSDTSSACADEAHYSDLKGSYENNYTKWGWCRKEHSGAVDDGPFGSHSFDTYVTRNGHERIIPNFDDADLEIFDDDDWRKMGNDIRNNNVLTHLNLTHCNLTEASIKALFGQDRTYNCPLKSLVLSHNFFIKLRGLSAMTHFMQSTPTLETLNLEWVSIDNKGARLLAQALDTVHITRLNLHGNEIGDDGLQCLLSHRGSQRFVKLDLARNDFKRAGYRCLSQFLQRDDTSIRYLTIYPNPGSDRGLYSKCNKMLIDSISRKSKLKEMDLGFGQDEGFVVADSLMKQVCDTTSFETLLQSNHYLRCVTSGPSSDIGTEDNAKKALRINSRSRFGASVSTRLRHKLRTFYFSGKFDTQPFLDFDIPLIPNLLELVTMTEVKVYENPDRISLGRGEYYTARSKDLGVVFHMLRNLHCLPELLTFSSPESNTRQLEMRVKELEAEVAALRGARNEQPKEENEEFKPILPNKRTKPNT